MARSLKKPKLTFILPRTGSANIGGMEMVAANLLHYLDPEDYEFSLVCFAADNGVIPRIDRSRVDLTVIEKPDRVAASLIPKVASYFLRTRPTLVHTFNVGALLYAFPAAKIARVPAIVHAEHGRHRGHERAALKAVRVWMTRLSDHVTAVSEDLRRVLDEEGVADSKVSVIINGVDTSKFDDLPDRAAYRRELGLEPVDWVVGTVGSLTERKNQQLLIRAAARLSGIKVLIAGDGPIKQELQALIDQLGVGDRVSLVGERSDIPQFLASLDVFSLPSTMEGTSLAILEAMAARLPVVATDVGGSGELVTDGETGRLLPSKDLEALIDRFAWTAANRERAREMGLAGRKRVEDGYSLDATVRAYDEVFKRVLRAKGISA